MSGFAVGKRVAFVGQGDRGKITDHLPLDVQEREWQVTWDDGLVQAHKSDELELLRDAGDDAIQAALAAAPDLGEFIAKVADALRRCGCPSHDEGPLQDCYVHGEQAARHYNDHAIGAMYHFAGIPVPVAADEEVPW